MSDAVLWHDLECGAYDADLPLWRALADAAGGPVLEVGAGTGRVALHLARHGHRVTALDRDGELLAALRRRAVDLEIEILEADARDFSLARSFALCLVPMQTVQLLGGPAGRAAFLRCARAHLRAGGVLAAAIADAFEGHDPGGGLPMPDMREVDGVVYSSQPVAVREDGDAVTIERVRQVVDAGGARTEEASAVRLDRLTAAELAAEGAAAGLRPLPARRIPPTPDHVGSEVAILRA